VLTRRAEAEAAERLAIQFADGTLETGGASGQPAAAQPSRAKPAAAKPKKTPPEQGSLF
jgi:exodeoxyribonuclease VII large subunit